MRHPGRHLLGRRHVAASAAGVATLFLVPLGSLVLSEDDAGRARQGMVVVVPAELGGEPRGLSAVLVSSRSEADALAATAPGRAEVGAARAAKVRSAPAPAEVTRSAAALKKKDWKAEQRRALDASPVALASAERVDLNALARARSPLAIEEHARLLADGGRAEAVRVTSARVLGSTATPLALELLLRSAAAPDPATRRLAAAGLGERREPFEALGALERLLTDSDPTVRLGAMRALTSPHGAQSLARHLETESRAELQLTCLDALGQVGGALEEQRLAAWSQRPGPVGERATTALAALRERLAVR